MTEIFTTGPHQCGDYDPRINPIPTGLSTDDLIFYCTLRNVFGIFASLIAILGIIGNVISLIILPKTCGARSAIVFLQSLGVYDTVFLVTILFLKTIPSISIMGHYGVVMSNAMSPALFPLMYIAHIGAIYSTICISSERCIAVVFPLHAVRILTMKRVKTVAVGVLVWAIVYNIPRYMLLKPVQYWEPSINRTWVRLEPSIHAGSAYLVSVYFGYVNTVGKVVIPVTLVSVLNVILLCFLRRRRHYLLQQVRSSIHDGHAHYTAQTARGWGGGRNGGRHGSGTGAAGQASNHRVTSVVLAITGVFLLSQVFTGTQVLLHLLGLDKQYVQSSTVFAQVCDTVVILVSATNFLLYYAFGEKFRKIIRSHICCKKSNTNSTADSISPGGGRREETTAMSMRTYLHSNGDISAEVERSGSGELVTGTNNKL
ncbi:FMRFamide receptor-like [Littorina saxatilis]|uniref:G-protein coupled receptors family 1 profile domain-containing protein n=1 Tax=Littorina saxatilis TaxID=31220 RepID=A0AAN9BZP5_9CAEN